jgi:G2/mitotic-specific cyclin 1/2
MFLAAKMKEIVAPSAVNFLYCADSSYTEAVILQAEKYIFKTLEWNMGYLNPIHFLRRVSKADEYNVHARTVAKYFLEIECVEWRLVAAPPSLLAAASIMIDVVSSLHARERGLGMSLNGVLSALLE